MSKRGLQLRYPNALRLFGRLLRSASRHQSNKQCPRKDHVWTMCRTDYDFILNKLGNCSIELLQVYIEGAS